MADLTDARPSCPECGCLMVIDANTDYAYDPDNYHWVCRRICDHEKTCYGRRSTPRSQVMSGAFRTEDMAIKKVRAGALINSRLKRGHDAVKRAIPELEQDNPLRTYLSSDENELVDVALHVLGNLANSFERANETAPGHDADWQALQDMAAIDKTQTDLVRKIAEAFLSASHRSRSIERARCLDEYVKRHHGQSPGLRELVRDYLGNPFEARWDALVDAVGRVLTTEAYNVRPFSFEQYWKGWRENLPYRRAISRVKSLAFFDPDSDTAAFDRDRHDQHQG